MPVATHISLADESKYNTGRYRGIGLVTLPQEAFAQIEMELLELLDGSGMREFEWKQLIGAREKFAALKLIEYAVWLACEGTLRIDVLTWDTYDSRHAILGRDDIANLERMYYHLLENTLRKRWPDGSTWFLRPDENSAIDWQTLRECLVGRTKATNRIGKLIEEQQLLARIRQDFNVLALEPSISRDFPLIQLADLFVGLSVYSREHYEKYVAWLTRESPQKLLLPSTYPETLLSKSDRHRCPVLHEFNRICKKHKLGVSLKKKRQLHTFNPNNPINFWSYVPQRKSDKAPVRGMP